MSERFLLLVTYIGSVKHSHVKGEYTMTKNIKKE